MNMETERKRLLQEAMLHSLFRNLQLTDMLPVYCSNSTGLQDHGIYCALVPSRRVEQVLSTLNWDLTHNGGVPGSVAYHGEGKDRVEYLRFGNDDGIEPLVIDRIFHGMREDYKEISEEFRLFHRLYHDKKTDQYLKFDDDGNETVVAVVEDERVLIRVKEIRQFLAIREMHLSIQFDCREHSIHKLKELELEKGSKERRDGLAVWGLFYGDLDGIGERRAFSRLFGKRLVEPLPKSKSSLWGFEEKEDKKHIEFIIGLDEYGNDETHTSNPGALANLFGVNPDAPNYLTPVHFRRQVLDKYFQQPSKYSVGDSMLRCGSLWSLQIDNHHEDKVCAWLGDLGTELPFQEQLYWRSFNIHPQGDVSKTYFRRQILAQFADSERPDHIFVNRYAQLQRDCSEHLGWQLLLPLDAGDEYFIKSVRIPATDEQRDFDELVLGLTKMLIDSLNEKELNKLIAEADRPNLKGSISRLEAALQARVEKGYESQIAFLRKLQNLRSSSSAHRKGSNYTKIANDFGVNNQSLSAVFTGILVQALEFVEFLTTAVREGYLRKR